MIKNKMSKTISQMNLKMFIYNKKYDTAKQFKVHTQKH